MVQGLPTPVSATGRDGQALLDRGRGFGDTSRDTDLRRVRVHGGVPGGSPLPRRQDPRDRRGNQRDPTAGHRTRARVTGLVSQPPEELGARIDRALAGNAAKDSDKLARQKKLPVRDRLALLIDRGTFTEDGLLANTNEPDLPADGVVTGFGRVDGRHVCVIANDPTVKAGSWGARTVEKIVRMTRSEEH